MQLRAAAGGTPNGVYIHDRRSGARVEVVSVDSRQLDRHATDELYGIALGAGLDADVTMVTGCQPPDLVNPNAYRRLVSDLRANGKLVIADLTGPPLRATLDGGVELLRLSEHDRRASPWNGRRCAERDAPRSWYWNTRRDRAPCRARDRQALGWATRGPVLSARSPPQERRDLAVLVQPPELVASDHHLRRLASGLLDGLLNGIDFREDRAVERAPAVVCGRQSATRRAQSGFDA